MKIQNWNHRRTQEFSFLKAGGNQAGDLGQEADFTPMRASVVAHLGCSLLMAKNVCIISALSSANTPRRTVMVL